MGFFIEKKYVGWKEHSPILALQCLEHNLERTFFQLGLAKCVRT
jgi:hypothetical protein